MRPALGTALLGVVLLVVAGLFDAAPLYVPGIALPVAVLVAVVWVQVAARGARVERRLERRRVEEGEPLTVRVVARAGLLPFPGGELVDPLLPEPAPLPAGRASARVRIDARFARRGLRTLAAPTLALRDPLALAGRSVTGGDEDRVLVLPRIEPVRAPRRGETSAIGTMRALLAGAAEVEVDAVRPYRPGTPASRIHWPALARGAGLLERRMLPEGDSQPLVVLDASGPAGEEQLDAAVRAAASLCHALARAGGCLLLIGGDRRLLRVDSELGGWDDAHTRLALVRAGRAPAAALARRTLGALVYVAARPLTALPRAFARRGGDQVLVVPAGVRGDRVPAFAVAGCVGYVRVRQRVQERAA